MMTARCSGLLLQKRHSRTGLCLPQSPFPGNAISRPENEAPKHPAEANSPLAETKYSRQTPPTGGLFAARGEISGSARVRGGPERTRTACQARSHIEPVSETSEELLGS